MLLMFHVSVFAQNEVKENNLHNNAASSAPAYTVQ